MQIRLAILFLACAVFGVQAIEPWKTLKLWPGKAPGEKGDIGPEGPKPDRPGRKKVIRLANVSVPTLSVYKPKKPNGAAVVICPGGGYSILGISLEAQNGQAVDSTLKAIKDKKIEHEFVPGQITYTPNYSIFKKQIPTMSKSKLLFKIDGTPVPFIFYIKQLVWLGKEWKIFNAEI